MNNFISRILQQMRSIKQMREAHKFVPRGHFYSPIPSLDEVRHNEKSIFTLPDNIPGVDLNVDGQMRMLDEFAKYYGEMPFKGNKASNMRYYFENEFYSYSDAIILYSMIRHMKPKKVIEVGSGYSSCVLLDTNEKFFDNSIQCTFIEPYPDTLFSLVTEDDRKSIRLTPEKVQDVDINEFLSLTEGDFLFIDSSHVSKAGSDVNYIFSRILPLISSGVYIHFHDIFYPFEYPKEWIYEGRAWNEAYLLRAFLQYNNEFEIMYFNSFMALFYRDRIKKEMPLCLNNNGGSVWVKKR